MLVLVAFLLNRSSFRGLKLEAVGATAALLFILLTDWITRPYAFFVGPWIRGEILLGTLLFIIPNSNWRRSLIWLFCLLTPLLLALTFFSQADGRLLFSDDHSSVLYRLYVLKENFPFIPVYNPMWNAGLDNREFFATGILNLFLLFSPLIYLFDIAKVYNLIVALTVFIVGPLSMFYAARIACFSRRSAAIAGALSLLISLNFHRWEFQYGSMGFVTSVTLIPLSFALCAKLLVEQLSKFEAMFFVIISSLVLCWSPTAFVFIPAVVLGLLRFKKLWKQPFVKGIVAALLIINIPWILLFISVSKVGGFVSLSHVKDKSAVQATSTETVTVQKGPIDQVNSHDKRVVRGMGRKLSVSQALRLVREEAVRVNPLIFVFALPALLAFRKNTYGKLLLPSAVWLAVFGVGGALLKPQLELERLLLVLLTLLTIPIAAFCDQLFLQVQSGKKALLISAALVFGMFFAGVFSAGLHLQNRGLQQYAFASSTVPNLSTALKTYSGAGRVLFPGFVLHELSGGHLAPLAKFSGVPLVASSPNHQLWWYTDQVPNYYRALGPDGIDQYFDLMNASAVVTHERDWINLFNRKKDKYSKVWQGGKFTMYQRKEYQPTYFLEGSGNLISQDTHSVKVKVDGTSAVIKFVWYPFLKSSNCDIGPKELPGGVVFVELTACVPGSEVTIESVSAVHRVFG